MSMMRFRFRGTWVRPLSSVCPKRLSSSLTGAEPQYPPIEEIGPLADKLRRKKAWHDWLKSHDTVEEKLFELNMPRYWGWRSVILTDEAVPYNFLPWAQFATRTHLEIGDKIGPLYSDSLLDSTASKLASDLKSDVEDIILFEHNHIRRRHELTVKKTKDLPEVAAAEVFTRSLVNHLNQALLSSIVSTAKYLNAITVVPDPRLEAFWFVGGVNPSPEKLEVRKARTKMTNYRVRKSFVDPSMVDLPVNEPIQFYGKPILQLQTRHPLPPAEALLDEDPRSREVPYVPYEPSVMYLERHLRRATTVPGFWPGEPQEFGMMSFHSSNFVDTRPFHNPEDNIDAIHSVALLSSFSWLLGQACYQGFSTFHDVTYPFMTQSAFTNGKEWSFYLHQLNTTLIHTKNSTENPRCNLCWATKPASLYQDIKEGRVIGLNEDVLKQLIKMYLVEPKDREGTEMKPYLSDKPHIANIDFEERRMWLEGRYKHLTSNRPRHREMPEVYAWEYIYKIKHNRRPRDKRTQWFATQSPPPEHRRLDDHPPFRRRRELRNTEELLQYIPPLRKVYRNFYPGTNKDKIIPPGK